MYSNSKLKEMFGNPNSTNYRNMNIIEPKIPFSYRYSGELDSSIKIRCHKLVKNNFEMAHKLIWAYARQQMKTKYGYNETTAFYDSKAKAYLRVLNLDICGGSYFVRAMRGSSALSHHSYGIAIDIDPVHNPMTNKLITTLPDWYIKCWKQAGFCWGGDWTSSKDAMHFEVIKKI